MVARKQILPGFAVHLCIVRTISERDPGFAKALRSNVLHMMATQPRDGSTYETLSIFLSMLDDPTIFQDQQ